MHSCTHTHARTMQNHTHTHTHTHTECLEELGLLIQNNGMFVCGSQPQKTASLVAAQISDRDNAVRSAPSMPWLLYTGTWERGCSSSLLRWEGSMVVIYGNVGEGVFQFTTQVGLYDSNFMWRVTCSEDKAVLIPIPKVTSCRCQGYASSCKPLSKLGLEPGGPSLVLPTHTTA